MAYEIDFLKPENQVTTDNRVWFDALRERCPFLYVEEGYDPACMADESEATTGLSRDVYLARGIGLRLFAQLDGFWVSVDLGAEVTTVSVPNFPSCDAEHVLRQARPIFDTLTDLGFGALDPKSGDPITVAFDEAFRVGYAKRQASLQHVASLVGGRVIK